MELIDKFFVWLNGYLWGPPLLVLLLGTHLFFTLRLRFIQRHVGLGIRISLGRKKEGSGDISQFGALTTALAATIGTGNVVGVATAVALGGPGAIFWVWLTGVFGISTKYAEALLAVKYRVQTPDGWIAGGPMYVLQNGLKQRWLAILFSIFTAVAAFGIGNMVQANSIATMLSDTAGISPWLTGAAMAVLVAIVIIGGIRSIARVCEMLVPFMAALYVLGCLAILAITASTLPETIALIVRSAFTGHAAAGGFVGATMMAAIRFGIARGLFSNESGLGSAPIVAAAAQTKNPVRQALVSSTGTFWDTVVVCAMTGLVLVNTGAWQTGLTGARMTSAAFGHLPGIGSIVLSTGLFTFVFSTMIGWSYYGERAIEYLFGKRAILPYRWIWVMSAFAGAVAAVPVVWNFADSANALMAIPNLVSLLLLSNVIVSETRRYLWLGNLEQESAEQA
ncbi:MAG: sodium:alanine symporter family protein [Armatimonadetes bacterium]|nr:sodium:alanine symporter family protein [Armatimonadota bacterium]